MKLLKSILHKIKGKDFLLVMKEAFKCMVFSFMVLGVVMLIGLNLNFFSPFKNAFKDFSYLDLYYSDKLKEQNFDLNENIVLVNIDRLNRKEIADVLNDIQRQSPKVIGLDVIFKEEQDPIWDAFLTEKLSNDAFVFAYSFIDDKEISNAGTFNSVDGNKGYANFNFNASSAVVRNFQGIRSIGAQTYFSFPVMIAEHYIGKEWLIEKSRFLKKERPINYTGTRENFLILESKDILGIPEIPFIKDKIVMVGYLGNERTHLYDIEDKHFTPMNKKFVGKSPPDTFGLVIHANIVQMLLTNNYIQVVPNWFLLVITVILTFIGLAYFIYLNKRQLASYILRLNLVQLLFSVSFVWVSLLLFRNGILFKISSVIAVVVFSLGLIGYYKKLAHYFYKKYKWEGYFYHD
ncbi:CHASE2 domain-containing protein [Maribacter confluentis]|uniref:CHASE2 domain-containing protein n=1 Tax=Maribacter confluentis TaxID=1656093 RepID=A0ABT8RQ93_9FLAO|nr:CHASE2 domain-containing protein [Maribacter confluentis]MDO1513063.1 CHASE2 domain-containing protein [Maribacter confluentis]